MVAILAAGSGPDPNAAEAPGCRCDSMSDSQIREIQNFLTEVDEVLRVRLDPSSCYVFPRPRPLLTLKELGDPRSMAATLRTDRNARVLDSAIRFVESTMAAQFALGNNTGSAQLCAALNMPLQILRGSHFSGRTLWAAVRRHCNRPLKRCACMMGGRAPPASSDLPAPCLACDLVCGNITYALLTHEAYYCSFKAFDCALAAPALAVSYIDGLSVAAAVAAGRLTNQDVHCVVSEMAVQSIADAGFSVGSAQQYNVRMIDSGPGTDGASFQLLDVAAMAEGAAGLLLPSDGQAAFTRRATALLKDLHGDAGVATARLRAIVTDSSLIFDSTFIRAALRYVPRVEELAQRHAAYTAVYVRGVLCSYAVALRFEARIGLKYAMLPIRGRMLRNDLLRFFYAFADKVVRIKTGDYLTLEQVAALPRGSKAGEQPPRPRSRDDLLALCEEYPDIAWARRVAIEVGCPDPLGADAGSPRPDAARGTTPQASLDNIMTSNGCAVCGAAGGEGGGPLSACRGCRSVAYCGTACQTTHWPMHKAACKSLSRSPVADPTVGVAALHRALQTEPRLPTGTSEPWTNC